MDWDSDPNYIAFDIYPRIIDKIFFSKGFSLNGKKKSEIFKYMLFITQFTF